MNQPRHPVMRSRGVSFTQKPHVISSCTFSLTSYPLHLLQAEKGAGVILAVAAFDANDTRSKSLFLQATSQAAITHRRHRLRTTISQVIGGGEDGSWNMNNQRSVTHELHNCSEELSDYRGDRDRHRAPERHAKGGSNNWSATLTRSDCAESCKKKE